MEQTEHQDLHQGGFLDLIEHSPAQKEFAAYFKQCLANNGVDFQTLDSKNYTMLVDEREFDPPAPPRPDSPAWAYFFGNMLVEGKCMVDNLPSDMDFKRGLFESKIDPLKRKMKVHYGNLDWRGRLEARMDEWKNGVLTTFQKKKAEEAAKAVANNVDGFIELFRSNSHFKFGADDPYHHYMPKVNEDKWVAYQKFLWDKSSSNSDTATYGTALQPLMAALDTGLKKTAFKASLGAMLKSTDAAMVGQLVAAFSKASPSSCGESAGDDEMVKAVLAGMGIKAKLNADQANTVSQMLRGVNGADLNGKSVAEATEILTNTAVEANLETYYHAASINAVLGKVNAGQLATALSFGNMPDLYTGLFLDKDNLSNFVGANSSAFDTFVDSLTPLNTACANLAKALNDGCAAADAGLKKNGVASPVGAYLKASGLASLAGTPVTPESLFVVPKLQAMSADLEGVPNAFMAAVNVGAAAQYLGTEDYTSSFCAGLSSSSLMPAQGGMEGSVLNALAVVGAEKSFAENVSTCACDFLVSSGVIAVPSSEMASAVEEAFSAVPAAAEAVKAAQDTAASNFMSLTLDTGLADLGSLEVQYKC